MIENFSFHGTKEEFEAEMYRRGYTITHAPHGIVLQKRIAWRKDKPTEPGWYFWRHGKRETVYEVYEAMDNHLWAMLPNNRMAVDAIHGEWAGPIPQPLDTKDDDE